MRIIPVTMLTVSDKDEDVIKSFDSGVNSYVTKPVDFNKFVEAMKTHHFYWTAVSELPPK